MAHRKGVQFGSFTTFPIPCHGLVDPNHVPKFIPRHRTRFPTQSILRNVQARLHETQVKLSADGDSWIDPQGGWLPPQSPWTEQKQESNIQAGTLDDDLKQDQSEKRRTNPGGRWQNTRSGWQWQWNQTPNGNLEPETQTTRPAPSCRTSKKEWPKSDSFDLRTLASALPQTPAYRLHVDLTTVQPLLWSILDAPSLKTVSLLSCINSGLDPRLDLPACPGAKEIVVHSHPRFSKLHFKDFKNSPTIYELLSGIHDYFYAKISKKRTNTLTIDDRNTIFAAKSKRVYLRGSGEVEDDLRVDLLDGYVLFNGMQVLSHDEDGKVEMALELRREKRWDWCMAYR
ncbi:hypothetical protein EDD18DRAFT_1382295 [Armillaria luteobubalina]|uniref:DUF6699 domain-containing protein n=1 Tax=Armillaria luteobubalina TaxID=153913 RepID=A0AA39QA35_9AGAR|nr:hypothetical protein EDD18DRAFT_1382295 [Armillaria luteobubalina]